MQQPVPYYQPPIYAMQPPPKKRSPFTPACGCCLGLGLLTFCILGIPLICFGIFIAGNPDQLHDDFQANPTLAARYDVMFEEAIANARTNGTFDVSIAEREFESWMNVEYQDGLEGETARDNNNDLPSWLEDMRFQTTFDNGAIQLYGETDLAGLPIAFLVTAEVSLNTDRLTSQTQPLAVNVTEFKVGGINMPEDFRTQLSSDISETLSDELTTADRQYELTNLVIEDGTMEITGRVVD
jgi:hypothetical protein